MSPRRSAELSLEFVLLALLEDHPMHGYELYHELCQLNGISLIWNIKQPLLYAILEKLESDGLLSSQLVAGESYPPRKYFHLTETGRSSLEAWMSAPVRRARDIRQEFLARLIVCRRYGKSKVMDLIHAQQRACQAWSDELAAQVPQLDSDHIDEWMVHSFRANRVAGLIAWLDELERQVEPLLKG